MEVIINGESYEASKVVIYMEDEKHDKLLEKMYKAWEGLINYTTGIVKGNHCVYRDNHCIKFSANLEIIDFTQDKGWG